MYRRLRPRIGIAKAATVSIEFPRALFLRDPIDCVLVKAIPEAIGKFEFP